ncbi:MAG: metallophosphoesterase [Hominilimicola sp.]
MAENEHIENQEVLEEAPAGKKKKGRKLIAILVIIAVFLGLCSGLVIYQNNQLEKSFYQVKSNKVADNIRIVCIADMHLKEFGVDNERLVTEITNLSPDIIAVVGDMNMESKADDHECVISLVKKLNQTAPVYYSLGNHEIDAMLFKNSKIYDDVKKAGIKILNNETETVDIGGTKVDIIGLTQNPKEFDKYGKKFFDKAMEDDDNFKLVLNHYPENFLGVLDDYNIDLALAGHAHGGQVRVPIIGGLYAADQGVFPKLCDGYHEIGNSKLIITRGLGKSGIMPRINNKPEIAVVDISWY